MSKVDELKEEIAWLKALFLALFAADASVIGWLFHAYTTATHPQLILASITVVVLSLGLVIINMRAFKRIRKLRNL